MKPLRQEPQELTLPPLSEAPVPLLDDRDLEESSRRYSFALNGDYSQSEEIAQMLDAGMENTLREQAAQKHDFEVLRNKQEFIRGVAGMRNLSESESQILSDLIEQTSRMEPTDRSTFLEKQFGRQLVNYGVSIGGTPELEEELADPTGVGLDTLDRGSTVVAVQEAVRNWLAKEQAERKEKSWLSTAYEVGVSAIPFSYLLNLNTVDESKDWDIVEGELEAKMVESILWNPDPDTAIKDAIAFLEDMKGMSSFQAQAFAANILQGSWSDRIFGNVMTVADVATAGIGSAAKGAAKGVSKAAMATAANMNPSAAKVLGNFGKTKQAAQAAAARAGKLNKTPVTGADRELMDSLEEVLGGHMRMNEFWDNYTGPYQHLAQTEVVNQRNLWNTLTSPLTDKVRPSRFTDEGQALNERITENYWRARGAQSDQALTRVFGNEIGEPTGAILEPNLKVIKVEKPEGSISDIGYLTLRWGNPVTNDGFNSEEAAKRYAQIALGLSPVDTKVHQSGAKYFVTQRTPVIEKSDGTLRTSLEGDSRLSDDVRDLLFNQVRTADKFFSKHDEATTKVAQHLPAKVKAAMQPAVDNILAAKKKGTKKSWKEFTSFLDHHMTKKVQVTDRFGNTRVETGYWSPDANSLQRDFYEFTLAQGEPRAISFEEMQAYLSYIQVMDFDWAVRATKMLQEQSVKGIKQIEIPRIVGDWTAGPIKGRVITKLPEDDGREFTIAHLGTTQSKDGNAVSLVNLITNKDSTGKAGGNYTPEVRKDIQNYIDNLGYKLIEVAQPDVYPLKGLRQRTNRGSADRFDVTDERVDYILVPNVKERNLRLIEADTLNRSQGGHWNYLTKEYVVQDKVTTTSSGKVHVTGQMPVAGFRRESTKIGNDIIRDMNNVRNRMQAGDEAGARAYIRSSKLPYDEDDLINKFRGVNGEPPVFDVNIPFRYAKHGSTLEDADFEAIRKAYPNARRDKDYKNNLYQDIDKKYVGERTANLDTIVENEMGRYVVKQAPIEDALTSLNSAAHNMVRGFAVDNAKKSMVDKWIAKYGHLLDADISDVRSNPVWYFHNGTIRTADKQAERLAKVQKQAVVNFLGTHSDQRTQFDLYKAKMLTWIEDRFGGEVANIVEGTSLIQTRDPFKFARGFAFHTKIGLFNPIQLFLQAQSFAHGAMIVGNPKTVAQGLSGYTASRMLMLNANQTDLVKSIVRKMGWDADDFIESHKWMTKYGINRMEGEHILLDNHMDYKVVQNGASKILDKGTMFFREGELVPRMTAWHMAWQEWRKNSPGRTPSRSDLETIARRQDDLTNNMGRKSAASLQHGWTSTATQFWSWQARLMESMLGQRLTGPERARLMIGYAAMYGIPGFTAAAVGIPTGIIGAVSSTLGVDVGLLGSSDHYGDIKKYALENGMDFDSGVMEVLMDGLMSTGLEAVTGKDTNWAQRMGPGGILLFENIAKNEAGILDVIGGAALGIGLDAWRNMAPLAGSVIRMAGGDQEFNATRTWEEFIQGVGVVSSVNNARLAYDIMRMGEYRFRSGTVAMKDLEIGDALLTGLVGLSPQEIPDAFLKQEAMSEAKGAGSSKSNPAQGYLKDYNRLVAKAVEHYQNGNLEAHKSYEESAAGVAEIIRTLYPDQAWKLGRAFTGESMVEQIGKKFEQYLDQKNIIKETTEEK